jgi:hypothetical protein
MESLTLTPAFQMLMLAYAAFGAVYIHKRAKLEAFVQTVRLNRNGGKDRRLCDVR